MTKAHVKSSLDSRATDMARTTINVWGDMMVALLVCKSENERDEKAYNDAT